jgi:hypothetical protein
MVLSVAPNWQNRYGRDINSVMYQYRLFRVRGFMPDAMKKAAYPVESFKPWAASAGRSNTQCSQESRQASPACDDGHAESAPTGFTAIARLSAALRHSRSHQGPLYSFIIPLQ